MTKIYQAIGLMSGTSMDGIDLALIKSDGKNLIEREKFSYQPYDNDFKKRLSFLIYQHPTLAQIKEIENELTILHANFVKNFLTENKIRNTEIDLVAFHGHSIFHNPMRKITWQIGNANLLASLLAIDVIADFRSCDVALGGQGAPLVPIYHFHLFAEQNKPAAVLNIGGISNITYLPDNDENNIEAFDVCFGNAPFDDLMRKNFNRDFDKDGELSDSGEVSFVLAKKILRNEIFNKKPPKSFDRNDFKNVLTLIADLKVADALATLAFIHAEAIKINLQFFPKKPVEIFLCGGGRKNRAIISWLKKLLPEIEIKTVENIGKNGDAIEAEAFAFLGIRSLIDLPLTFTKTTGISAEKKYGYGGVFYAKPK